MRKNEEWQALPTVVIICLCISIINAYIGIGLFICYILGCICIDLDIKKQEKATKEQIQHVREEINYNRKNMSPKRRQYDIKIWLNGGHLPNEIKWQRDAFPDDVDIVLEEMGLIYDEKSNIVINKTKVDSN